MNQEFSKKRNGIMIGCGFNPTREEMQAAFEGCMRDVERATEINFNKLQPESVKRAL